MAPKKLSPRDRIIANLKTHSGVSPKSIDLFKELVTTCDYFSRSDHRGGLAMPDIKHYRIDGSEHVFSDVPWQKVMKEAESFIEREVPKAKRTDVFKKVMADIPGAKAVPDWDKPVYEPHEKPETEFSVSRADPEFVKSNEQLISDLAKVAELEEETVNAIRIQITWWDGMGDDSKPCLMSFSEGIRGGRLGRDHTLEDVPNHYVRDRLVDYVQTNLKTDLRSRVLEAVLDDLSAAEIEQYSTAILRLKEDQESETGTRAAVSNKKRRTRVKEILTSKKLKNAAEIKNVLEQEAEFDAINSDVDPNRRPGLATRRYSHCDLFHSVIKPDAPKTAREQKLDGEMESSERWIDRDCDQIRTMIKDFTREGEWTPDQFRKALGAIERAELTAFLKKRGPSAGSRCYVYELAWEFFKRREKLGLPLKPVKDNALHEASGNGRKTRSSDSEHMDGKRKRQKRKI